jgi:hypothetical protein
VERERELCPSVQEQYVCDIFSVCCMRTLTGGGLGVCVWEVVNIVD